MAPTATTRARTRAGRIRLPAALALSAALAAGCVADPPPPVEQAAETTGAPAVRTGSTITVTMDGIGGGFNPHLRADASALTAAVAEAVLPSPFRYRVDPYDPDGAALYEPDADLITGAEVIAADPMIVEYRISNAAQWSDGAPIAAEDFRFLWQKMITEPGVVDPAPYRMISDVRAVGEGGKIVHVVFAEPYDQWRTLFAGLLPAHLIKDTPGGFATGLTDALPVSGAHFKLAMVDRGRGEVVLRRNDRFWGVPASADQIVIRRGGDPGSAARALRGDDTQIVDVTGGAAMEQTLSTVPGATVTRRPEPRTLTLTVNARNPHLADDQVRAALIALLDPDRLAVIGSGSDSPHPPEPPAWPVEAPMDREAALAVLLAAGAAPVTGPGDDHQPPPTGSTANGGGDDDSEDSDDADDSDASDLDELRAAVPAGGLPILIAVPTGDRAARDVALAAADSWSEAGVTVTVVDGSRARDSYGDALLDGTVGVIVDWQVTGADPAAELASRFGCDDGPIPRAEPAPRPAPPSNLGGVCDPALAPVLLDALAGRIDTERLYDKVRPVVTGFHTVVPILQADGVVAIGPDVIDAAVHLPLQAGLFVQPGRWTRLED